MGPHLTLCRHDSLVPCRHHPVQVAIQFLFQRFQLAQFHPRNSSSYVHTQAHQITLLLFVINLSQGNSAKTPSASSHAHFGQCDLPAPAAGKHSCARLAYASNLLKTRTGEHRNRGEKQVPQAEDPTAAGEKCPVIHTHSGPASERAREKKQATKKP